MVKTPIKPLRIHHTFCEPRIKGVVIVVREAFATI